MHRERFTLGDVIIYTLLALLSFTIVFAFMHLLSISLSSNAVATKGGLIFVPREVTLDNYSRVFKNRYIWIGYKNTLFRTVVGTSVQLVFTALGAYVLSKKYFPHRSFWTLLIVFTMFFSGGLIPTFLLVKNLGLTNTYASMILPGLVSAYNLTIMRNFFQSLPEEIEESCMIDGAGRMRIFWQFILPLSTPILATVALWLAVGHWNAWFDAMLYIRSADKQVLAITLRRIVLVGTNASTTSLSGEQVGTNMTSETIKAATIMVATIPILCVYPFLQRYFVKGIMVGAVKG